jgi:hypothetical protein
VADHHRAALAERADQVDHVAHQMQDGVLVGGRGFVGAAVAAHVRGDHAPALRGQRLDLRAPADRQLRESVQQEDERAGARLKHGLGQTVGGDPTARHPQAAFFCPPKRP